MIKENRRKIIDKEKKKKEKEKKVKERKEKKEKKKEYWPKYSRILTIKHRQIYLRREKKKKREYMNRWPFWTIRQDIKIPKEHLLNCILMKWNKNSMQAQKKIKKKPLFFQDKEKPSSDKSLHSQPPQEPTFENKSLQKRLLSNTRDHVHREISEILLFTWFENLWLKSYKHFHDFSVVFQFVFFHRCSGQVGAWGDLCAFFSVSWTGICNLYSTLTNCLYLSFSESDKVVRSILLVGQLRFTIIYKELPRRRHINWCVRLMSIGEVISY